MIIYYGELIIVVKLCRYAAAHLRVRKVNGPASGYECVHCGMKANEWSYDHLDIDELIENINGSYVLYSGNPNRYIPLCRKCHRLFDWSFRKDNPDRFAVVVGSEPEQSVDWYKIACGQRRDDVLVNISKVPGSLVDVTTGAVRCFSITRYEWTEPIRKFKRIRSKKSDKVLKSEAVARTKRQRRLRLEGKSGWLT